MAFPNLSADARDDPVASAPVKHWRLTVVTGWVMGTEAWIWMGAWALVMVLVVWLLVREPHHETPLDPSEILRDRYARGEISEEEFRRAMATLDSEPPVAPTPGARHNATHHTHQGQGARHD